mmetsp:Transcript_5239/g.17822  ORF Transcript_5239/g.17822 Transcript_5239/m.17822 type:complete len:203 (-) Transcript_5239:666-1274(-)
MINCINSFFVFFFLATLTCNLSLISVALNNFMYSSGGGISAINNVISSCLPRNSNTFSIILSAHSLELLKVAQISLMSPSEMAANTPSLATSNRAPVFGTFTLVTSGSQVIPGTAKSPTARDTAKPPGYALRGPISLPSALCILPSLHPDCTNLTASKGSSALCSRVNRLCARKFTSRSSGSCSFGCGNKSAPESPHDAQTI